MPLTIRNTGIAQARDAAKVHVLSWKAAYKGIVPDEYLDRLSVENRAERFRENYERIKENSFVAANDGEIIGVLAIHKSLDADRADCGEIEAVYLLPEYWGRGYGKQMMDFAIHKLNEWGFRDILLWVLEENLRARKFYEKCGFAPDGTKKETRIEKPLVEIRYCLHIE